MRTPMKVTLNKSDRATLEKWARNRAVPRQQKLRARIVLMTADGISTEVTMRRLDTTNPTLNRWRRRFIESGVAGLAKGRPRGGGKTRLSREMTERIVTLTVTGKPAAATHWSCRSMAKQVGVSPVTVYRIWRVHGLKPHQVRGFKISNDPHFAEKLRDVIGLYLDPPERAIVLSVDEKSGVQALDRTQPGLPMKRGRSGTMTHDYKRHGVTTLFAALDVHAGSVLGQCMPRHRHDEFLRFLRHIDKQTDKTLDVHLIVDNYATHKHPAVKAWLAKHPRFHMHFTPTSASWLNLVERLFRDLTEDQLRRGVFRSVPELITAIEAYLAHRNAHPVPYRWTATPDSILEKIERAKTKAMSETQH